MAPLGLGLSSTSSMGLGSDVAAVVIEDYFWELDGAGS